MRGAGRGQRQRPPQGHRRRPLADAIVEGEVRRIDLLRLTLGDGDDARTRYAHSYIGVGLTPIVAIDLEKGGKGSFKEILSVVRTFAKFRPFTIDVQPGGRRSVDSLVFANIPEMAKYATLSESGRPDDGRFEVITVPHTAKWRILGVAVKAATRGLGPQPTARHYRFTTLKPTPLQLDGEIITTDAATPVCVDIAEGALATLGEVLRRKSVAYIGGSRRASARRWSEPRTGRTRPDQQRSRRAAGPSR